LGTHFVAGVIRFVNNLRIVSGTKCI